MATYYIPTDITGGTILVNEGDVFIFESGANNDVSFQSASGSPTNFQIQFDESNANGINISIGSNLSPNITIADGVSLSETSIQAGSADTLELTAGDNVTIKNFEASSGNDTISLGDNFTTTNDFKTQRL